MKKKDIKLFLWELWQDAETLESQLRAEDYPNLILLLNRLSLDLQREYRQL